MQTYPLRRALSSARNAPDSSLHIQRCDRHAKHLSYRTWFAISHNKLFPPETGLVGSNANPSGDGAVRSKER